MRNFVKISFLTGHSCQTIMKNMYRLAFVLLYMFSVLSMVFGHHPSNDAVQYHDNIQLQQWIPEDHIIDGWDWSLPPSAKPSPYGFMVTNMGPAKNFPGNRVRRLDFNWKELEPVEGEYNFDVIIQRIEEAKKNDFKGVAIYIKGSVWETLFYKWTDSTVLKPKYGLVPNWENADMIFDRSVEGSAPRWLANYAIPKIEEEMTKNNANPFQIINLDIYHEEYHARYLKLVEAFGKSKILDMPEVVFSYMNFKSRTHGEEGPGENPSSPYWPIYRERMQAWANAAGERNAHKITLSGNTGKNLDLALDTFRFGQRNGFVEMYLLHCDNNQLGITLDEKGYMHVDENLPAIKENRVWGDENEEYPERWIVRFGPLETFSHRYRESELRALQMRRNVLWESNSSLDPHLTAYVAMSLGHKINSTSDVWCYLRESYIKRNYGNSKGEESPVKNFERWLVQRDTLDAFTKPSRKVVHGTFGYLRPTMFNVYVEDKQYDFTARVGNKIGFFVAPQFLNGQKYALKITYWDNADFELNYHTSNGYKSVAVKTENDDKLKTATFFIEDLCNNKDGYFDIYITSIKGAEVSFLRLVKL